MDLEGFFDGKWSFLSKKIKNSTSATIKKPNLNYLNFFQVPRRPEARADAALLWERGADGDVLTNKYEKWPFSFKIIKNSPTPTNKSQNFEINISPPRLMKSQHPLPPNLQYTLASQVVGCGVGCNFKQVGFYFLEFEFVVLQVIFIENIIFSKIHNTNIKFKHLSNSPYFPDSFCHFWNLKFFKK